MAVFYPNDGLRVPATYPRGRHGGQKGGKKKTNSITQQNRPQAHQGKTGVS